MSIRRTVTIGGRKYHFYKLADSLNYARMMKMKYPSLRYFYDKVYSRARRKTQYAIYFDRRIT